MWVFTLLMSYLLAYLNEGCSQYSVRDCQDIKYIGFTESGVYRIIPDGTQKGFDVYCDMETDGGGWLVFQRRIDGSERFNRTWEEYQMGFGNVSGEFWLGNLALYTILLQGHYELRQETRGPNLDVVNKYIQFKLGDPADLYRMSLASVLRNRVSDGCTGSNNGVKFSTDETGTIDNNKGGWWLNPCSNNSLNAHYWVNGTTKVGIRLLTNQEEEAFVTRTELKIRKVF